MSYCNAKFLFWIKKNKTLIYQRFIFWRRHPDSNRGSEFCRLVPYHLAISPYNILYVYNINMLINLIYNYIIIILYKIKFITFCNKFFGAGNGAQTRDLRLGKAALYQLSYSRINSVFIISKYIIKVNTSLIIFFYIFLFFYLTFVYVLC